MKKALAYIFATMLLAAACDQEDLQRLENSGKQVDLTGTDQIQVEEISRIGDMVGLGENAEYVEMPIPDGSSAYVVTQHEGNTNVIRGGSTTLKISYADPAKNLGVKYLYFVPEGEANYYRLPVDGGEKPVPVTFNFAADIPGSKTEIVARAYAAGADGAPGEPFSIVFQLPATTSSGKFQVTVSWDTLSDVDLHVIEPGGFEIYFGEPDSDKGGKLDLDSNAGCVIDEVNNENVFWDSPPSGEYKIGVMLFDSCGLGEANYTVTVNTESTTKIVKGQLVSDDAGVLYIIDKENL